MKVNVRTVRPGVHFVRAPHVNWTVLTEGRDATLIDSGYPRQVNLLLQSLAQLNIDPAAIVAVVITHAHTDHQGGVARLRANGWNAPLLAHHRELANVRREVLEQVTARRAGWNLLDPRVARWSMAALKAGGLEDVRISDPIGVDDLQVLDLPGRPQAVLAPGHTSGHVSLLCAQGGVLIAGDAIVSAHPTMRRHRTTLPAYFHVDAGQNARSAVRLRALRAELILPGHGPEFGSPQQ